MRFAAIAFSVAVFAAPLSAIGASTSVAGVTAGEEIRCCNPFAFGLIEDIKVNGTASKTFSYFDQALDPTTESGFLWRRGANAQASASAGVLRVNADAGYFLGRPDVTVNVTVGANAVARFTDTLRVLGPGSVAPVTFEFSADGGLNGAAVAQGGLNVNSSAVISFLDDISLGPRYNCSFGLSCNPIGNRATLMLPTNTPFTLTAGLGVIASARGVSFNLSSSANYANTGRVFVTFDSPQYQLISDSGFDYRPVPIPEPGSLLLFALGLVGLSTKLGVARLRFTRSPL